MSNQLIPAEFSRRDNIIAKYRIKQFVYLAAISAVTVAWLWLIGWAAMRVAESAL
jgi:hypothetical protein